jgi:2-(1,2-epoxy-1,2-dihydrophenyl)acetyl-CoA isomerase
MHQRGVRMNLAEQLYNPIVRAMRDAPFPIVAGVNGPAVGISCTLSLMCDTVVAARSAYFLLPFVQGLASIGDIGITWLLPRLIGLSRARRMLLYSERVGAETAFDWGLVDAVHDDDRLAAEVRTIGKRFASGPTLALGGLRRALWDALDNSYERQLDEEIRLGRIFTKTDAIGESVTAFIEKRPPR